MNEHKTPEQIAQEALETHFIGVRTEVTDAALVAWMITAIEADRAQREQWEYRAVHAWDGQVRATKYPGNYNPEQWFIERRRIVPETVLTDWTIFEEES